MKKMIEYEIKAKLWFDIDANTEIEDYLDNLRGIGEAEVVNVRIVNEDENGNIKPA
jgi:hypothetical protein